MGELSGEMDSVQSTAAAWVNTATYLKKSGKLTEEDLLRVHRLAEESGEPDAELLVRLGIVSEDDLATAFSECLSIPLVKSDDFPVAPVMDEALSQRFMKEAHVIPLYLDDGKLVVAVANPDNTFAKSAIEAATGHSVEFRIGLASAIDATIERLYGSGRSAMGEIVDGLDRDDHLDDDVEHLKDLASEAPVIRLVNLIIQRAVQSRASDIHIEPFEDHLKVRYRIDGVLEEVEAPPAHSTAAVISRIKIMAKLNIAERRLPQDGRITLKVQGKELDMRVSTVPTLFGESLVMRLLDKENVSFDFEVLGFSGDSLKLLRRALELPHGIILVTGPTGSGKSTTLYTALHQLNTPGRKIITVEDPVEYQLEGINQIQVKPQIGLDFANSLRAIVRQDPDVIMVGEMRDIETVRVAVQSALTGHLVLSTLHTNDASGAITRLLDMGVEDYLLTSTVNCIVAQRLVRRLCVHCREPYIPPQEMARELNLDRFAASADEVRLYRAKGCEQCGGSGFHGQISLSEVLVMTEGMRKLVMQHANASELHQAAVANGMDSMYQDGMRKVISGLTSMEEVARVCEEA